MLLEKTMKILPLFIILFFFSGAIIFTYLAWTTMRDRDEPETFFPSIIKPRGSYFVGGGGINAGGSGGNSKDNGDGRTLGSSLLQLARDNTGENDEDGLGLLSVNEEALIGNDLQKKIEILKMKVVSKLRRHILDGSKLKGHINHYGVNYTRLKSKSKVNRADVLCRIKKLHMKVLDESSSPLFRGKKFPSEPLFSSEVEERSRFESGLNSEAQSSSSSSSSSDWRTPLYRSCAVIPNSAALDGAKHGIDIDSHDFILRFNDAPTQGYEDDVGALTSMRIINSQVATKPIFGFPSASYFSDLQDGTTKQSTNFPNYGNNNRYNTAHHYNSFTSTSSPPGAAASPTPIVVNNLDTLWEATRKYLIWDPCNYGSTIEKWYKNPDFPLFAKYFNLTSTKNIRDRNRFYILDCRVIWKLWELLQEFSFTRIHGTPPTSGFIGIILALQKCERVNIFEYIPSVRESSRCHYYGLKHEINPSCTYGSWHPVSAEKLFFLEMTDSSDKQIFLDGVLSIPGVSKAKC